MEFFSSLLLSIASFFGISNLDETIMTGREPIVQEVVNAVKEAPGGQQVIDVMDISKLSSDEEEMSVSSTKKTVDSVNEDKTSITEPLIPEQVEATPNVQTMIVAGGCFWCVEADLEKTAGVIEVVSGYSGGTKDNPTYQNYGSGGHREVVEVTYDANQVSFEDILIVTMKTTDPTDDDGTFGDRGDKYSSAFYYENNKEKEVINGLIKEVDEYGPYNKPLAVDVEPRTEFWRAEDRHQDYYKGTLSQIKYNLYRTASGRPAFINEHWGTNDHSPVLPWRNEQSNNQTYMWSKYQKPNENELKEELDETTFKVTQKDSTERAGTSPLDKNWEEGIYVDVLSGEPLFSSKDKFDSGTGWPSFVRPITETAVEEREDQKLFVTRTEVRSAIADNHLGHVFSDGPKESTGLRYCMNGVALKFIPKADMEEEGYVDFIKYL